MERLLVGVIVGDECVARTCRLDIAGTGGCLSGGCDLHADEPRWSDEGFLAGQWLGPRGAAAWLEQPWCEAWHLRDSRRIEAVLQAPSFGQFAVRALLEEFAGQPDAVVVGEQTALLNSVPCPLRLLRHKAPGLAFALRPTT